MSINHDGTVVHLAAVVIPNRFSGQLARLYEKSKKKMRLPD
jgi:hypothetical protein